MLVFMTNKVPFFSYLSNILLFLHRLGKCAISEVSAKNRIIFYTDSINMWISADKACHFLLIFQVLRQNDVITISYWKYGFRFEIRVSKFVRMPNFNS